LQFAIFFLITEIFKLFLFNTVGSEFIATTHGKGRRRFVRRKE
jgi:uncharacterized membrane protein YdjX (TVP38/TMEM64 family)